MDFNYMKLSNEGGVLAILQMERGCLNEKIIVDKALEMGFKLEKSTKEEYESLNNDEILISSK